MHTGADQVVSTTRFQNVILVCGRVNHANVKVGRRQESVQVLVFVVLKKKEKRGKEREEREEKKKKETTKAAATN